jgi:hypothetical protein
MANTPHFIKNCLARFEITKTAKRGALLSSLHHFDENTGRTRQKRADRRGNILQILEIVIPQLDLDTFAWGQWFTNHKGETDFYSRGVDYIVDNSGLSERTVVRVFNDLERCGYMKSERRDALGKEGALLRHYSLRKFTTKFFIELGFKKKTIEGVRSWKRKKNETSFYNKKMSKTCKQGLGRLSDLFKKFGKTEKSTKSSFSIPFGKHSNVSNKIMNPTDTKNLLYKAKEISDRLGTCPVNELRILRGLQPQLS